MHRFIRISLALWINIPLSVIILLSGCAGRAPSLRMLDTRAGYGADPDDEEVAFYQRGRHSNETLARRSAPRVVKVYVYPHELPSRDYFWGGFVSLVVSQDEWIFENPMGSNSNGSDDRDSPSAIRKLRKNKQTGSLVRKNHKK